MNNKKTGQFAGLAASVAAIVYIICTLFHTGVNP